MIRDPSPAADRAMSCALVAGVLCFALIALAVVVLAMTG